MLTAPFAAGSTTRAGDRVPEPTVLPHFDLPPSKPLIEDPLGGIGPVAS